MTGEVVGYVVELRRSDGAWHKAGPFAEQPPREELARAALADYRHRHPDETFRLVRVTQVREVIDG